MSEPFDFHVDFHGVKKLTPDDWKMDETQLRQAFNLTGKGKSGW